MTFDEIRASMPEIAISAYAMEPGGPVTLEIITPTGDIFTFHQPTLAMALAVAFPPEPMAAPEPAASIFD